MSFLDFIRDVGKHITVNYMMAKDSVKKRLEGDTGMSFTEFTYQLVQGYDFFYLFTQKHCKLQMGGSDQWGNIVTGTELIRRKSGGEAFAFTCPLITKADGGKFGKTEKGNVWLDASKTSPYAFYQFWLNTTDGDAEKYIRIFTFLSREEIDQLILGHHQAPHLRGLQKRLAREVTCFIHGEREYDFALRASDILFGQATREALEALDEKQLLQVLEGVAQVEFPRSRLEQGVDIVSFLADTKIFPSRGEARKTVQNGGIAINKEKVEGIEYQVGAETLINKKYLLVQKGKKSYFLIRAV